MFIKGYESLSFAKNIGKNLSKNVNGKYSGKHLDHHTKQSATDSFKTASKRAIQKTAEVTGDLNGKKADDRITKVSKILPQNNSKAVTNQHDKEISKERYISLEERHKTIDDLRLI